MTDLGRLRQLLRRRPADGRHCAPATWILVALLDGPQPLPRLLDAGRELGCGEVGHGTFFGALARLEAAGLIEPAAAPGAPAYRLTSGGIA